MVSTNGKNNMTPNEYQALAMRTRPSSERFSRSALKLMEDPKKSQMLQAILGIANEAGELCKQIHGHLYYDRELDIVNVKEEGGDLLWWIAELLDAIDCPMEDGMKTNIMKLITRYPEGYSDFRANNRNLEAERAVLENKL